MQNYYTNTLNEINKAGIDPESIHFVSDGDLNTAGIYVTLANNMSDLEYYKEVVFNKGQLISFQKENVKCLDAETKEKINKIQETKIQLLKHIDELLTDVVKIVTEEEMKYKPAKKIKP